MILEKVLNNLITEGALVMIDAKGTRHGFGEKHLLDGASLTMTLHDKKVARAIALDPDPGFGEAYMEGRISFQNGRVWDFLQLIGRNLTNGEGKSLPVGVSRLLGFALRTAHQLNPAHRSRKNAAHHYDLSGELYDLFLDADRQYSCAYFARPDMSLDEAQVAKKQHIARKLALQPGQHVLDIGCGWGGMALTLAEEADVQVLGVTLSREQLDVARARAEKAGLSDRVRFELIDYRHIEGTFDRIVSVGMFEHVGVPHYQEFFRTVQALLKPDGVALLHTIGRNDPPGITSPFIRKYIFPGGYLPALSEVVSRIEKCDLMITDVEILRLHYAETLRHWRKRFLANWHRAEEIYDARFCRMWEFYLAASEMSFRFDTIVNFQIQLTRANDVLPLTRDYMYRPEPESPATAHNPAKTPQKA